MSMSIAEALVKLRTLKGQISRATTAVEGSITHYEDQAPEYSFTDELVKREELDNEIVRIKTAIQRTNAVTNVTYNNVRMTLAELILRNGQVRSDIAFYTKLANTSISDRDSYFSARTKDQVKKVVAEGFDKRSLRAKVDELEVEKENMSSFLTATNFRTNLVEG
jgi:hypothetical protein